MLKLRVRSKLMAALAVLLILATPAGAWLALKLLPDKLFEMHILLVMAIQVLVPLFFAATIYQTASGAQKIRLAALMIAIGMLSAAIGNFCSPGIAMKMLGDQIVLLSLVELGAAVIGGVVSIVCLYTLAPESVYTDSIEQAAQAPVAKESKEDKKDKKEREKQEKLLAKEREKADKEAAKLADKAMGKGGVSDAIRATGSHKAIEATLAADEQNKLSAPKVEAAPPKGEMSNSATNLRGLLDTISPEDKPGLTAAEISAKADAVAKAAAAKTAAEANAPGERKPTSSSTATRLQAQKRKSTSTFTKLQALSASGTGTQRNKAEGQGEEGSESLKSILDRLDETADEPEMDSLFGGGSLLSSGSNIPTLPKEMPAPPKPAVPDRPQSQLTQPSQFSKPGGTTSSGAPKPTVEPAPIKAPEVPKPIDKPAVSAPAASAAPAPPAAAASGDAPSLSSMLDSIATPQVMQKEVEKPVTSKSGLGATSLGKAATGKKLDIKIGATSMDNLPAMESPTAAITETSDPAALAEAEAVKSEVEATKPATAELEAPGIFGTGGVDKDIDDIFSALVPEEAQKEVQAKAEPAAAPVLAAPVTPTPVTPIVKPPTPATPVASATSAPVTPAAPVAKPSIPAPDPMDRVRNESGRFTPVDQQTQGQGALFETGIDKELDDIFSNLVPEEAQKEVSTRTTGTNMPSLDAAPKAQEPAAAKPPVTPPAAPATPIKAPVAEVKPPTPTPAPATPPAPNAVPADEKKDSLFASNLDKEIDDIFSNLAPTEAQKTVSDETLGKVRTTEAAAPAEEMSFAPPADTDDKTGKFVDTLGNLPAVENAPVSLSSHGEASTPIAADEQSFAPPAAAAAPAAEEAASSASDNGSAAAAAESNPAALAPEAPRTPPREIKEFGRLSTKVSAPDPNEATGTMKTIGKLLIDVTAVENIIKSGETGQIGKNLASTRVISQLRGEGIKAILVRIDSYEGVAGSLIVGHDGLVIASTLPQGMDKDSLGVLSVACVSTSNLGTRKLEIGKLKQMVLITNTSISVLTDVDVGILAVFMKAVDVARIDGLLDTIHETIHGS